MSEQDVFDEGSRVEATVAVEHHRHHPADPNEGLVRGRLGPGAITAALVAAALTVGGIVWLALAIGAH